MLEKTFEHDYQTRNTVQLKKKIFRVKGYFDYAKPLLGDSFLDVGCGNAVAYDYLRPAGYCGVDYYQENMTGNREKHPEAEFICGDIFSLDRLLCGRTFDFVLCCRLLIHLPRFEEAMQQLLNATRKYCMIIVEIGEDKVEKLNNPGPHYYRTFSKETISSIGECKFIEDPNGKGNYSAVLFEK